jgi:hypothetical protein
MRKMSEIQKVSEVFKSNFKYYQIYSALNLR